LKENLQKISKTGEQNLQRRKDIFRTLPMRIFIIAGIVAVCALAAWLYFTRNPVMDEVTTRNGEIRNIILTDSTAVILNGNASLSYPADFLAGDKREVWIEGEGFLCVKEVAGAGSRYAKFVVHTNDLDVETFGSSFNVKSIDSASGVSVNSGK
jgi:ferric-dicitrate binding protein FerR (iron transport regulator)